MSKLKNILGKKLGMTRVFSDIGEAIGVTLIEAGPCYVIRKKTIEKDGYNALVVGYMPKKLIRTNMPEKGLVKKAGFENGFYYIREIGVEDINAFEPGQELTLTDFDIKQLVDITGVSKGKGFQGTVKRHNFHRGRMGHGSKHHREMGSTGQNTYPARVLKGKKMPGRMGGQRTTIENSMVFDVRPEMNLILVKGSVPGANNEMIIVHSK
jgi:large subunit ribosomal protein L3